MISIHKTQKKDIDIILAMENTTENAQFIIPNSKEEHIKLVADSNIEHLLIKSSNDNSIVGFVILAGLDNTNNSIEFRRIVISQKGKGYGRKVIKEIKKYCFTKLKCHRLWLDVLDTNQRAFKLYVSEGFKQEGILRDCLLLNNEYKNLIVLSILENEYH